MSDILQEQSDAQNARLFTAEEAELLDAARMVLSAATARIKGREVLYSPDRRGANLESSRAAREVLTRNLQMRIGALPHEQACAALLDAQGRLITIEDFANGSHSACQMPYREIARAILKHGAAMALLAHNHPSGRCEPSRADTQVTAALTAWLAPFECVLIDSLVVTADDYCAIKGDWSC
jgi:DNA repair protein RadC